MRASHRLRPSIGVTIGSLVDIHYRDRASLLRIRDLGRMVASTAALIHELQRERGLTSGSLAGGGRKFDRDLEPQTRKTDDALGLALGHWETLPPGSRSAALETAVGDARLQLEDLKTLRTDVQARSITAASATHRFASLIDRLLVVIAEAPGTSTHPQVTLALISLFNFVLAKEYTGQERALGSAVCAQGTFEPFQFDRLEMLDHQRTEAFEIFGQHATAAQQQGWQNLAQSQVFLVWDNLRKDLVRAGTDERTQPPPAESWFDNSTALIDALRVFESRLLAELDDLCLQVLADSRSAWEDSQEIPDDRDTLRWKGSAPDPGATLTREAARSAEEASRWKRRLDQALPLAQQLAQSAQMAKILSLDVLIPAVSAVEVGRRAKELSDLLNRLSREWEVSLQDLRESADRSVGAFEEFHSLALEMQKRWIEASSAPQEPS